MKPIYDMNYCGFDDKFATSVMFFNQERAKTDLNHINSPIFHLWRDQVDFNFGLVSLQEQVMPDPALQTSAFSGSLLQVYDINNGKTQFLQARIPIQSQLNVKSWEEALKGYWGRQLLELIKFHFQRYLKIEVSDGWWG